MVRSIDRSGRGEGHPRRHPLLAIGPAGDGFRVWPVGPSIWRMPRCTMLAASGAIR
jgi:hypothetical protein